MSGEIVKRKLVALVTNEVFTPYKAGEVFCVPEEDAQKLLREDKTRNEYGVARYPKVKVRLFNPEIDGDLLLKNGSLNMEDHNLLLNKLHPDRPAISLRISQYKSEITDMLDGLDPERGRKVIVENEVKETDPKATEEKVAEEVVAPRTPGRPRNS